MTEPGTVLITGPTRNLGRHAVPAMAARPDGRRPDLLLVGRAGRDLTAVAAPSPRNPPVTRATLPVSGLFMLPASLIDP
jgi:short-subunit dehydrogenase